MLKYLRNIEPINIVKGGGRWGRGGGENFRMGGHITQEICPGGIFCARAGGGVYFLLNRYSHQTC